MRRPLACASPPARRATTARAVNNHYECPRGSPNLQGCIPWTQPNVYDAAWGIGWDVPDPEIYFSGQVTEWSNIETNSKFRDADVLQVYSVMTECEGPDIHPTGNGWVYRRGLCEYSPTCGLERAGRGGEVHLGQRHHLREQYSVPERWDRPKRLLVC